jgi:hypothetical protein
MNYEASAVIELRNWQKKMIRQPSTLGNLSRKMQQKLNSYIPEKVHKAITAAIKEMIKTALFGAKHLTA